jgi:predicted RNA methylase
MTFSPSSKDRLTEHDLSRFPGDTLFDRVARAVCAARCLPRKELYEAWEVARRTRRLFRGGRVVDLGGGHGLLAQLMLLLDPSSPDAVVVDPAVPPSAARVHEVLSRQWPRLAGRVLTVTDRIGAHPAQLR